MLHMCQICKKIQGALQMSVLFFYPQDSKKFKRTAQAKVKIEIEAKDWLPCLFEHIAATFIRKSGF